MQPLLPRPTRLYLTHVRIHHRMRARWACTALMSVLVSLTAVYACGGAGLALPSPITQPRGRAANIWTGSYHPAALSCRTAYRPTDMHHCMVHAGTMGLHCTHVGSGVTYCGVRLRGRWFGTALAHHSRGAVLRTSGRVATTRPLSVAAQHRPTNIRTSN